MKHTVPGVPLTVVIGSKTVKDVALKKTNKRAKRKCWKSIFFILSFLDSVTYIVKA